MTPSESASAHPVVRIAHRRAKAGCAESYEAMVREMFADIRKFPGFLGAEIIPPANDAGEYQVVMRFATQQDLDRWDLSDIRQVWHQRLHAVAEGDPDYRYLTGLEAWFELPAAPADQHPVRWKMALTTWMGIFPTVSLLLYYVAPLLGGWPFLLRTAAITGLVVVLMTWVIMPRLVRALRTWLFRH